MTTTATLPAPLLSLHPEMGRLHVRAFGLVMGMVVGLDFIASSMIGVAGNHIQGGVHASPEEYLWAVTIFAVTAVMSNLIIGRVAGRISYRTFTLWGIVVFVLGALLCAAANGIGVLTLGRAVQGLGGGGLFTAARVVMQLTSKPQERGTLFWGFGLGSFGLLAMAPWASAELVELFDWRAVFLLQAALGALVWPLVWLTFPLRKPAEIAEDKLRFGHLDWPAVLAVGVGTLLCLHIVQDFRYFQPSAIHSVVISSFVGIGLVLFIASRMHTHPDPWLDVRRLGSRRYLVGLTFYGLFYLISGYWNLLLSGFLQSGLGFDFSTTGLLMTLGGIATVAMLVLYMLNTGRLFRKRRVIVAGFAVLAVASSMLASAAMPGASTTVLLPGILLQGLTSVLIMLQTATMTYLDFGHEDFAHAYQLKNILREIATALGTGLASLMLQNGRAEARTDLVARFDSITLAGLYPEGVTPQTLAQWSTEIDRQATLIASNHLFLALAALSIAAGLFAAWQRKLR
ncbi:MFS transporter [Chitinimonas sp.]|uniref:MFS transporter n=1 Tax=Chitinimonas sp. TaxID=1934313 RepID=UPI002F9338DA